MFQRQHEKLEKIISEHDAKRNQNVLKDHKALPGSPHLTNESGEATYAHGFPWLYSVFPPEGSQSPLSPLCLKSTVTACELLFGKVWKSIVLTQSADHHSITAQTTALSSC